MPDTPANDPTQRNLYCVLAQHGLGLHNSGRTYLCCQSRQYLRDHQDQEIYLDSHSLEQAWQSPTRREIQQALAQGQEHPSCQACWDDEHAGKTSRRQYHNSLDHAVAPDLDQPQIFDLKMGNVCNMRCRTCNPEVSSQWYREDWALNAAAKEQITFRDYLVRWRRIPAAYGDHNDDLWSTLKQWIPNAVYIDYYGAEPMLIDKNFEVLQYAVDQGTAGSIDLHFSTNGTIWNQDIEQLLGHFRRVYFDLSIDDIGTRCGYIRYPSDWDQVNKNLLELQQAQLRHPQFVLCVCITVTNLNIYYLDEIYDHFSRLGLPCNFNFLHLPWQLNLKVLPAAVKQQIMHKLRGYSVPAELDGWYHDYWNSHMPAIENFMMTAEEAADQYFREFHYYTRGLDRSRDQSLERILPEFAALIKPWFDQFDSESSA